jgi:hypothetical protein
LGPVACVLGAAGAAPLCRFVAGFGQPVTVLGPGIALVRAGQQVRDLLPFRGALFPGGPAIVGIGLTVPLVSYQVAFLGVSVPRVGGPVPLVGGVVPLVGGPVDGVSPACGSFPRCPRPVTGHFGRLACTPRLVAGLRLPIPLVGRRHCPPGISSIRGPVALVGGPVALVGGPVALVIDASPLILRVIWRAWLCPGAASARFFPVPSAGHGYHPGSG